MLDLRSLTQITINGIKILSRSHHHRRTDKTIALDAKLALNSHTVRTDRSLLKAFPLVFAAIRTLH